MARKATANIELKDAEYWHRFYLYKDQDFVEATDSLQRKMNSKYGGYISLNLSSDLFDEQDKATIEKVQTKYGVTNEALVWFTDGGYAKSGFVQPHSPLLEIEEDYIKLVIFPNTKLSHVRDFWSWIENAQKDLPGYKGKSKSPKYPDLIYAIHRARRDGKTFKQIAMLFDHEQLQGVDYSNGVLQRFNGEEDLEKYYRLYQPERRI